MTGAHQPDPRPSRAVSRRSVLGGAAVVAAAGLVAAAPASGATPLLAAGKGSRQPFVAVRHGQFSAAGKAFRFGGTNCYYLHQQSHYMIDSVLDDAAAMALTVVRAWAFADGSTQPKPLQPNPYEYDEAAFDSLDYAVWKAGQLGIRLVLPLVNNWPDYGGMQQYVQWFLGLPDDSYGDGANHDKFYTDKAIRKCYKAYARHVIQRLNRYTGLRYCDDPTVMTFELANEPRNRSDKTGAAVLGWVTEMSAWIKQWAPRQLVSVGDEGFYGDASNSDYPYSNYEGDRWKQFLKVRTVDYGTFHLYPQGWGDVSAADPVGWGTKWITDHIADGKKLGKPVVLEEYGLQIDATKGIADAAARDAGYLAWTATVEKGGLAASDQFWILTSRIDDGSYYPDYDGYRIVWRNDADNPSNSTAQLLAAHAKRMATN
ncbi:MAG: glycoside hydrolase 5 family protein [Jatrophihabitans sp.]